MIVSKETIEREAKTAAREGKTPNEACPYPFGTAAALHWVAVHAVEAHALSRRQQPAAGEGGAA